MHGGNAVPLVPVGTRMSDAVVVMTQKSLGCVIIVAPDGRLMGIITDGDLRRHMTPNLLELPVEQIMTREPKTVRPDQLASEALEFLNSTKRTQLIVAEDGKPIGIIHVHDLLRAGVA
jgi:arabinose-5-phosphate isomerase